MSILHESSHHTYIDKLVRERHNSSALAMELYVFLALTYRYVDYIEILHENLHQLGYQYLPFAEHTEMTAVSLVC